MMDLAGGGCDTMTHLMYNRGWQERSVEARQSTSGGTRTWRCSDVGWAQNIGNPLPRVSM
jgi:hypothetical protein